MSVTPCAARAAWCQLVQVRGEPAPRGDQRVHLNVQLQASVRRHERNLTDPGPAQRWKTAPRCRLRMIKNGRVGWTPSLRRQTPRVLPGRPSVGLPGLYQLERQQCPRGVAWAWRRCFRNEGSAAPPHGARMKVGRSYDTRTSIQCLHPGGDQFPAACVVGWWC